jgi:hypothetical protein
MIGNSADEVISGKELLDLCCDQNVKLLWIASDNPPKRYFAGFPAEAKRINLVMTLRSNGPSFPDFLQKMLFKMFYGQSVPVSWNELCPQIPGSTHEGAPENIFFAGHGVRLR